MRLILLYLLFSLSISAQIKGVVVDENNQPISYVNIWTENETLVGTSEEDGTFIVDEKNSEINLVFTAIGYEKKTQKVSEAMRVVLNLATTELQEVQIQNPLLNRFNQIAKYDKNNISLYYGLGTTQLFLAKKFTFNDTIKDTPYLKSIILNTRSDRGGSSVRIRIKDIDKDGNPGDDLINDNLILKVKSGNRNSELDVSKYKFKIGEEGIFVVVEFLILKENEYILYDKNKKSYLLTKPSIGTIPSEEVTFWVYNKNWKKMKNRNPYNYREQEHYYNKYIELAMSLKLTN